MPADMPVNWILSERLVDAPLQVWRKRIQTGKVMVPAP